MGSRPCNPRSHGDHERDRGEHAGEGEALDGDTAATRWRGRAQRGARGNAEDVGRDAGRFLKRFW